jgi:hypothetical protein
MQRPTEFFVVDGLENYEEERSCAVQNLPEGTEEYHEKCQDG